MRKTYAIVAALAVGIAGIGARALACPGAGSEAAVVEPKQMSIAELDGLLKDKKASVFDANGTGTRAKFGVIPGAVLLSNYANYSLDQLPEDKGKKLVFYCANTMCTASHVAAKRALAAGYGDVAVLPDGIMGWKQAGKPTEAVPRS
jgi:rhodanese-related sulfurtransferase